MTKPMPLLDEGTVAEYLHRRGILPSGSRGGAIALGGGVSNIVLALQGPDGGLVCKQSLPQLRVADEWLASQDRILAEAAALQLAGYLTPSAVPRVIDIDPQAHALVLERAPDACQDWKTQLLNAQNPDEVDHEVPAALGQLLATWHSRTAGGVGLDEKLLELDSFNQLRVDPFYRTAAERCPPAKKHLHSFAEAMNERRDCLVHGDFSPKNVLVGPTGHLWVIDFEVAHLGDPAFDLAFLLSHLLIKTVHCPLIADALRTAGKYFIESYIATLTLQAPSWDYVAGHVGCLIIARVHGKSPAPYLSPSEADTVRNLGLKLLADAPDDIDGLLRIRA